MNQRADSLLQCDALSFGYAGDTLFSDVTFRLHAGERLALVAPNGAGKTTLLKLLTGELAPERGRAFIPPSVRVGYLTQNLHLAPEMTVENALLSKYGDVVTLRADIERLSHEAASGDEGVLNRLANAQDRYELLGGHALESKVASLASRVGFRPQDMERTIESLSGGERGRLALGVVLASEPRVLFLDEPTNHLDLETTEQLEKWLQDFEGAAVIVSHDRAFLDATCNRTAELGERRFRLYEAPYSEYLVLREDDLAREEAAFERQQEEIAKTEDFIRRNLAGQNTKQAQGRRKMLAKVERLARSEDIWSGAKRVSFRFAPAKRSGDIVIEASKLGASRGGRELFGNADLLVKRGDRIGIIGPNGAGKSTLLKILAGQGASEDLGEVRRGTNLEEGYFDQHLESLDPNATAIDEIRKLKPELINDAIRQYLARFRLTGDDPFRAVKSFSGGEKTRLALSKLLLVPRNLLFLDEPTNHLDIPASEILEEALSSFEGAVVVVSHDRFFLDRVCTKILRIANGVWTLYPGSYSDYRDSVAREAQMKADAASESETSRGSQRGAKPSTPAPQASAGRDQYEAEKNQRRDEDKRKRRREQLEKEIASLEKKQSELKSQLLAAPGENWEELARLADEEQKIARRVDSLMTEWESIP